MYLVWRIWTRSTWLRLCSLGWPTGRVTQNTSNPEGDANRWASYWSVSVAVTQYVSQTKSACLPTLENRGKARHRTHRLPPWTDSRRSKTQTGELIGWQNRRKCAQYLLLRVHRIKDTLHTMNASLKENILASQTWWSVWYPNTHSDLDWSVMERYPWRMRAASVLKRTPSRSSLNLLDNTLPERGTSPTIRHITQVRETW